MDDLNGKYFTMGRVLKIKSKLNLSASVISLLTLAPFSVNAAGFQLNEQSAAEVGMANAGTAVAPDASVQFFNPAGIAALSGFNFLGGGQIIVTSVDFRNQGSTSLLGTPVSGDASGDSNRGVPEGYVSYQLDDRFTAGLAIYTPFGLATTYPDQSSVRYFSESTSLNTFEINPNIAFRLNNQLSFGAGPAIRYSHANLSSAIDDGGIATGIAVARGLPPAFAAAAGGPESNNARFDAVGDDWDVGYKIGALFQPDKGNQHRHRVSFGDGEHDHGQCDGQQRRHHQPRVRWVWRRWVRNPLVPAPRSTIPITSPSAGHAS